jgi:signal transduction histidine kinase
MDRFHRFQDHFLPWLIRRPWAALAIIMVVFLLLEIADYILSALLSPQVYTGIGIAASTVLLPVAVFLIFRSMAITEAKLKTQMKVVNARSQLGDNLTRTKSWNGLADSVLQFVQAIVPTAHITIFLPAQPGKPLQAFSNQTSGNAIRTIPRNPIHILQGNGEDTHDVMMEEDQNGLARDFSLELVFNQQEVGLLSINFPDESSHDPAELDLIVRALSEISMAIEAFRLQDISSRQADINQDERRQIARDLHDTLAQNIALLHMKLDQLSGDHTLLNITNVIGEINIMRDIADEAYLQVRQTLDNLNPVLTEDLMDSINKMAAQVGARAGFMVTLNVFGAPSPIPSVVNSQIYFIIKEALINIEKHAFASKVKISLLWTENNLDIMMEDNGVGYQTGALNRESHYGLKIMRERASQVGGSLQIKRIKSGGTEVSITIPINMVPYYAKI